MNRKRFKDSASLEIFSDVFKRFGHFWGFWQDACFFFLSQKTVALQQSVANIEQHLCNMQETMKNCFHKVDETQHGYFEVLKDTRQTLRKLGHTVYALEEH